MDVWGATICFNTVEAAKKNIPKPETWKDLTKPVYKGQIVMPHPASSGTGFFDVTAWLQMFGEAEGWKFMDGLHENIAQYMHSGSRPCAAAAAGEYVVGISFEYRANREKARGAPIDLVFPKEGLGWDLEAIGIVKTTTKLDAAKKLADWAISDAAMALYAKNFAIVAIPSLSKPLPNVPADYAQPPREERLRVGREEPRQDPRRVEQALRVEGGAEVTVIRRAGQRPPGRVPGGAARPAENSPNSSVDTARRSIRRVSCLRAPHPDAARRCVRVSAPPDRMPVSPDPAVDALKIEGVHKAFGSFVALQSIDLTITPGELVCFVGPSGCGKTTLLRIIAGLEPQTRGRVIQNGRDVSHAPPAARDYGIVFQSYALFPNLTIADNVAYGLVNRRRGRAEIVARVKELLTLVGLPDAGGKYPGQLSGGQQQRVALARALATAPSLLLLDEPLSALDAKVRERLRGEIRALQRRLKVTTIMVTHDQEEALSMSDRVVVMRHGAIEQIGTPQDVYERPATPFVADFLGKVNVLKGVSAGAGRYRVGRPSSSCRSMASRRATRCGSTCVPRTGTSRATSTHLPNRLSGRVAHIEYLGTVCLADVVCDRLGCTMTVSMSLNQLHDLGIREGGDLEFALRTDRVRVFGEALAT